MKRIKAKGIEVIIYEPEFNEKYFFGSRVIENIDVFKSRSDLIVANRLDGCLADCSGKIFCRDIFREN